MHCLKCFKPQDNLPVHLARVCMKQSDPEARAAAVKEAKKSFKDWAKAGRIWDYKELCEIIPESTSRQRMMKDLLQRVFLSSSSPMSVTWQTLQVNPPLLVPLLPQPSLAQHHLTCPVTHPHPHPHLLMKGWETLLGRGKHSKLHTAYTIVNSMTSKLNVFIHYMIHVL